MQRWKNILFNTSLFLNCLLVYLQLFEDRLSIPVWLQVAGRMHPMILHFPVVLISAYAIIILFLQISKTNDDQAYQNIADLILLFAALSSGFTALVGLFLSKEGGYDIETLQWHKWGGVVISVFTLAWYYFRKPLQVYKYFALVTSLTALCLVTLVGHQGANITHGQDFLLSPLMQEKKQVAIAPGEAEVYAHLVRPILETKCITCHNSKKAKGELVMDTEEMILKGGKSGVLWDTTVADLGLMLRRIHLPEDQKKHMPPLGKPQLTEEEIWILTQWIKRGADFKIKVADLSPADTLHQIANRIFTVNETAEYDFEEAAPSTVAQLNTANRVVDAEAVASPALNVSFFNSQLFKAVQLKELEKIKKQVVSLDLSKMPVKDEDLKIISGFENLRKLNLNFTGITGAVLPAFKNLKFLKSLSLSGTKVNAEQLKQLKDFPKLKTVFTWNIPVTSAEMEKLKLELKNIHFETGFKGDTVVMKLMPPLVQNEEAFISAPVPLKLKHYINGATIKYTLDGSEPDSIHSTVFKEGQMINGNVYVRAKAFKQGWVSSDVIEANFYKSTHKVDSVIFLIPPDPAYKGEGKMLTDLVKGKTNFKLGNWLAWRDNRMETLLQFAKPTTVQSITLSTLLDVDSYIMPPTRIEIWGGADPKKLKLLSSMSPQQPTKSQPASMRGLECKFSPATLQYIKVIATPLAKLPAWHSGKGNKAWVFCDEVIVN
ncbi:chitobiase/beta-hexosaminidase C-terminal domain-containing protein [Chitinophagaceae bacterium LB-8]|uniref:Chitobiase/beta-hexosaminidase C-terminal domain-containing protein n=1 Tax=Paraflavisolibacter caeni TaxID=2982496 RepID=A0A9X3B9L2_9BACT|nr:c-type cytochrome domain-containing protein [Paraflavisolibacter caeni]MCU7552200.1 chitobiase/beta-hexosaminidase C-terminal domain-containing protein [Paraflavisolibacter caeni]